MSKRESPDAMLDKMVLAATLYYKEKLSQQEIAKRLNVSRPWVSKLLSRAEDLGIVKIEIVSPLSGNSELERNLCEKYGLQHAGVAEKKDRDYVSLAAAQYFVSQLESNDVVGIGWGDAISRFLRELTPLHLPNVHTVPLAGSFGETKETLPNYHAIELARKLGGQPHLLHLPAFCGSQEEYDLLSESQMWNELRHMGEHADLAVVGIGTLFSSFLTRNQVLSEGEQKELAEAGAVGDVILHFLNEEGESVETELTKRLLRVDIAEVKKHARTVIAIAEGLEKLPVIRAALRCGLADSFFTDTETAEALLKD
ncbi:MAG: MarR family transcriptional regulator [Clostridiales bacterium]|nr:MarR family transcriptional regulator [Clostridiales bacterium]